MSNISLKNILISQSVVSIAQFSGKQGEEFTLYCKPGNFDREGEITIIMDYQGHTVSLITFSIVNINNKELCLLAGFRGQIMKAPVTSSEKPPSQPAGCFLNES